MSTEKAASSSALQSSFVVPGAEQGIDEQAQVRIVDLHDVGPGFDHQLRLALQDRRHRLGEGARRPVGLEREVGVPHALGQQGRRRQRHLDQPLRQRAQVLDLGRHHPLVPDRHLPGDHRPRTAVLGPAELEPVGELGDDADVGSPPPLAVGDHVEAGRLLQGDGVGHRGVEASLPALLPAAVGDDLAHVLGPRQGADHRGGKQGSAALDEGGHQAYLRGQLSFARA